MGRDEWERERYAAMRRLMVGGLSVPSAIQRLEAEVPTDLLDEIPEGYCPMCGLVVHGQAKLAIHTAKVHP